MSAKHFVAAVVTSIAILSLGPAQTVSAQTIGSPAESRGSRTTLWTAAGAGAGFGIGIWAGLHAFDDAVNSERKVWTTAIFSAAAGGVLAYLISRERVKASPQSSRQIAPLGEWDVPPREAPALGSGTFRAWLELRGSADFRERGAALQRLARPRAW